MVGRESLIDKRSPGRALVIISADAEWRGIRRLFPNADYQVCPYGEWFISDLTEEAFQVNARSPAEAIPTLFFHGGWGKIAAAASTQYAIDRWRPALLVNLGTCGGFEGAIERGTILLVEKTIVYDIIEQMGDSEAHIRHYTTDLDLDWLSKPYPLPVRRSLLVSGDRDLLPQDILGLRSKYGALAGDWESGAIAFTATRNGVHALILRGVTDLVSSTGSPAYDNLNYFEEEAYEILKILVRSLPSWLRQSGFS